MRYAARFGRVLFASLVVLASGVFTYVEMFSQFQYYDDEGYIMVSLKSFLDGHPLYVETFSEYGPFYPVLAKVLYTVTGLPVSHDITRLATIGLWLATAAVAAVLVYRLTSSFAWASIAYLQMVIHCRSLCNEPGHPQAVLVLLSVSVPLIAALFGPRKHGTALLGAVAACMLLTKINVGVYTLGALTMTYLAVTAPVRLIRAGLFMATAASLVAPFLLMRGADWALNYARISSLTLAASGIALWRVNLRTRLDASHLWIFPIAITITALGVLMTTAMLGTPVEALVTGAFLAPLRFPRVFSIPWRLPSYGVTVGAVSVVVALIATRISYATGTLVAHPARGATRTAAAVLLKLVFGLLIAFAITRGRAAMVSVAPLVWVILIPTSASWSVEALFPRAIVCLLSGWHLLVAYPVGGSQQDWSTMLLVPAAIIAFADAGAIIAERTSRAIRLAAEPALLAASVFFYYPQFGWGHLQGLAHKYDTRVPLALPGASRIRLEEDQVQLYRRLVSSVEQECDIFVSMPGLYSLNFWTRIDPPTGFNNNNWMLLLDDLAQQQIVERLSQHERACVIYNRLVTEEWVGDRDIRNRPLVQYIRTSFRTAQTIGDFELLVRNARRVP